MTVDLIKENGIIQEVVINKAEYFDNNNWDKTVIDITSDMQEVVDEIIMIYDETAFGEPEPRCNSVYDYYGVGRNIVDGVGKAPEMGHHKVTDVGFIHHFDDIVHD